MPYNEKHQFLALNRDLEDRRLTDSMYRYLLNGITNVSQEDDEYALENPYGNSLLSNTLPDGDNTCIGRRVNKEENTLIFCNYNSNGTHGIYEYNPDTDTFTKIIESSLLGFVESQKITGMDIINGQLILSDNNVEIFKITLQRGKDGEYDNAQLEDLTLIRRPPHLPLEVSTFEDQDYPRNYINKDAFQFTYRFRYKDGEKSVFATLSKVVVISKETAPNTNAINVKIPSGETVPLLVDKIEWVFRTNSTNEYAIFKITDPAQRILDFHNDIAGITVPAAEIVKPFDDVPLKALGLRVSENRILINNYLHGYDYVPVTLVAEAVEGDPTHKIAGQTLYERKSERTKYQPNGQGQCTPNNFVGVYDRYWWLNNGRFFKVDYDPDTQKAFVQPGQGNGFTATQLHDHEIYPSESEQCRAAGYVDVFQIYPPSSTAVVADVYLSNPINQNIFKFGDTYQLGVKFSDFGGRHVGVSTAPAARVTIPDADDPANPSILYHEIQWTLGPKAEIPLWADYVEIVRTKNLSRSFFLEGRAADLVYGQRNTEADGDQLTLSQSPNVGKNLYLYIENATKYKIGYVFSEGDRCRIYRSNQDPKWIDLAIVGQDGPWLVLEFENIGSLGGLSDPDPTRYEIYTPAQGQLDELFYEIGVKYPITNPGTADRDYYVSSGTIRGDVYLKSRDNFLIKSGAENYVLNPHDARAFIFDEDPVVEDFQCMNPNDQYYERWVTDAGRATKEVVDSKQIRKRFTLKYGGAFTPDSLINNTSSFNAQDEYPMPYENGPAVSLESSNNVLLYFHERETSSIYIGEGFLRTQDGREDLIRVLDVVGDDRKLRRGHGTINPESIVSYGDDVFYWDLYKGTVVRYTVEGLHEISDFDDSGMNNYFYQLSRKLLPYKDSSKVYGAYDPYLDFYILTFAPVPEANYAGETIAFYAKKNRWVGWFSFQPEMYGEINKRLYSFKDGQLWKHADPAVPCNNFYGVQYERILRFVVNGHGNKVKVWESFRIDAESITQDMDGEDLVMKITNDAGQEAWVFAHHWEEKEGVFIITDGIKMDVNTPNDDNLGFTSDQQQKLYMMYNGDVMRSQVCTVEIINNRTDRSPMYFATMLYQLSQVSFV